MRKHCLQCGKSFEASRKDAKYCSDSCKVMYNQQAKAKREANAARRAIEEAEAGLRDAAIKAQVETLEQANAALLAKVEAGQERLTQLAACIPKTQEWLSSLKANVSKLQAELRRKPWLIYNERFNTEYEERKQWSSFAESSLISEEDYYHRYGCQEKVDSKVQPYLTQVQKQLAQAQEWVGKVTYKLEAEKTEQANIPAQQDRLMQLIRNHELRLRELDKLRFAPPLKPPSSSPSQPQPSQTPRKAELSALDIMSGDFSGFTLPGDIGPFMGHLERYMLAIAITGDPGAGKSYLTFELAKAFVDLGLRVKYYSLEEGIGRLTQEKLTTFGLDTTSPDQLTLTDKGSLSSLRKEAKALEADVFIVDSYGKLKAQPDDLDKLRQAFPNAIFVFIFQQTTKGGTKGGAAIEFDCSMRIACRKTDGDGRVAEMLKSRYGTQGWRYDPIEKRVIRSVEGE